MSAAEISPGIRAFLFIILSGMHRFTVSVNDATIFYQNWTSPSNTANVQTKDSAYGRQRK